MEKIDLVGLPSGLVTQVTRSQLIRLIDEGLVIKVINYDGHRIDKYCFRDEKYQLVKSVALAQIVDDLKKNDEESI